MCAIDHVNEFTMSYASNAAISGVTGSARNPQKGPIIVFRGPFSGIKDFRF